MRSRADHKLFTRVAWVVTVGVGVTAVASPTVAALTGRAPTTILVSASLEGVTGNGASNTAAMSADGRFVAFESSATDLAEGQDDDDDDQDIFVRDLRAGTTSRVSVAYDGGEIGTHSFSPAISADGRYVAFDSPAGGHAPGDHNQMSDVFVRDLVTGTTTRVSVDVDGGDADGPSDESAISADGRFVAFLSSASDLAADDGNLISDVFVRDLVKGTTTRVSVGVNGGDADSYSFDVAISADGRHVAFQSAASNLVPDDDNRVGDVFVRDLVRGLTTRASVDQSGGDADAGSSAPSISATGRVVAFQSGASDLVDGDTNDLTDVFVRDIVNGTTIRASVDRRGGDPRATSEEPVVSANGRYVAYSSAASDIVAGDDGFDIDVFVRDLAASVNTRISVAADGGDTDARGETPAISASGGVVAFESYANLTDGDDNGTDDVFVRPWRS